MRERLGTRHRIRGARRIAAGLSATFVAIATVVSVPGRATAHVPHDVITAVVPSPSFVSDHLMLVVSRGELLRSTDGGGSWQEIVSGIVRDPIQRLVVAPTDATRWYMVVGGGVFRSLDRGQTWQPTGFGNRTDIGDVMVSRTSAQTVFAAGATQGLYRSADGGQTWAAVGNFGLLTALYAPSPGRVVVGDATGAVWRSADDGTTWAQASGTASGHQITALNTPPGSASPVFAGTDAGALYESDDGGATFHLVGSGLPTEQITGIATSDNSTPTDTVWVSTQHSVYRSTNAGATFLRSASGLTTDAQAQQYGVPDFAGVAATPSATGEAVFVAGFDGLFRSNDLANSWFELQTQVEQITGFAVSPDFAHDHTVIASTYVKGVFISHDAGATWTPGDVGLEAANANKYTPLQRLHDIAYSPDFPHDHTAFLATIRDLRRSTDGGMTWTTLDVEARAITETRYVIAVSPNFANDRTVFLGNHNGLLFRSTTGGGAGSWVQVGSVGQAVRSMTTSPAYATDHTVFVGTRTGVYRSTDGGATWQPSGPSLVVPILAISPAYATDHTVFAGTGHGLYVTRDAGQTWSVNTTAPLAAASSIEAIAASPQFATDHMVLVSLLGRGLYRSTDGGVTFTAIGASLLAHNIILADYENPTSLPIVFSPTYAVDHTVFGWFDGTIVRSTDGGATWTVLGLPPASSMLAPPAITGAPTAPAALEGGPNTTTIVRIPVDLVHPSFKSVTVHWNTVDGTRFGDASSASGDFVAASGTLTFPAVTSRQYINVTVKGDATYEPDERLMVQLGGASNATLTGSGLLTATILNDD